jgi:hypothetical protein
MLTLALLAASVVGCVQAPLRPPRTAIQEPKIEQTSNEPGLSLASFADELALSLEPSKLEDETTATEVYVFNRGSRTWVIALDSSPEDMEKRSIQLDVRDVSSSSSSTTSSSSTAADGAPRDLPPAPIGITAQCPRPPPQDIVVVGPGQRGLLACVEKLVDVRHVEELELEANLRFKATDGSEIHVKSPAFRVARRPLPPPAKSKKR